MFFLLLGAWWQQVAWETLQIHEMLNLWPRALRVWQVTIQQETKFWSSALSWVVLLALPWLWSCVTIVCAWSWVGSLHFQGPPGTPKWPHGVGSTWGCAAAGQVVAPCHGAGHFMLLCWSPHTRWRSVPIPCPMPPEVNSDLHAALVPLITWGRWCREALLLLGHAGYK